MTCDAVLTESIHERACDHLLRHVREQRMQEELCFAFWRPSTGVRRRSALIFKLLPPLDGERNLHGNASFEPSYLSRAVMLACSSQVGLAFMHNHLSTGWQDMSPEDVVAERDRISPPARATGLPLVGLTLGTDGSWSARLWTWDGRGFNRTWCDKVRVVGRRLRTTFNDDRVPPPSRQQVLQRTTDTWGEACQRNLARLRMGVVGVGSVGCMVAEALARVGVERLVLIDPDKVETHNLDRLLHAGAADVGTYKVDLAAKHLRKSATALRFDLHTYREPVEHESSCAAALDCDILFSAVDRPLPKDLLNRIAYAHCVPVVVGGVFIDTKPDGSLGQAAWSVQTVGPGRRCLRCDGQYTTSDVVMERDGSFDDPTYIQATSVKNHPATNQNVFPFSANVASLMVIQMVRLVVAADWWPDIGGKLHYSMIPNLLRVEQAKCGTNCSICETTAHGDRYRYPFIRRTFGDPPHGKPKAFIGTIRNRIRSVFCRPQGSN